MVAEPTEQFEVITEVKMTPELEALRFPESVIYGVLDVLMVAGPAPLAGVRLRLKDADWDPVDTSAMAFPQAGRDAGRKIAATMT